MPLLRVQTLLQQQPLHRRFFSSPTQTATPFPPRSSVPKDVDIRGAPSLPTCSPKPVLSRELGEIATGFYFSRVFLRLSQDPRVLARIRLPALTLAEGDGFVPVEVALRVLGAGGGAVANQTVARVAAKADRAAGVQTRLAEDQPVGRRLREATVRSWREGQEAINQSLGGQYQDKSPSRSQELHRACHNLRLYKK